MFPLNVSRLELPLQDSYDVEGLLLVLGDNSKATRHDRRTSDRVPIKTPARHVAFAKVFPFPDPVLGRVNADDIFSKAAERELERELGQCDEKKQPDLCSRKAASKKVHQKSCIKKAASKKLHQKKRQQKPPKKQENLNLAHPPQAQKLTQTSSPGIVLLELLFETNRNSHPDSLEVIRVEDSGGHTGVEVAGDNLRKVVAHAA